MRSLARAVRRPDLGGEPLSPVFSSLEKVGVRPRRGEITMVAAAPSEGKTAFMLAYTRLAKVPTLYLVADTTATTVAARLVAQIREQAALQVEAEVVSGRNWVVEVLGEVDHIRWCTDPSLTIKSIREEVQAFAEIYGDPPEIIVVDNLSDVLTDAGAEEHVAWQIALKELKVLAREANSAVFTLHHMTEAVSGNPCPPQSAIQGKVAQLPALILSLAGRNIPNRLAVCAVKNRQGPAAPNGDKPIWLGKNLETMKIWDLEGLPWNTSLQQSLV